MKRFLSILSLVVFGFASMSCYDDSELWETVEDLDGRVQTLEDLCTKLNTNLTALSTLVQSMEKGDYVVSVSPLKEGSVEVGYRIVFKENGVVDIYHGQDGADGKDGQDGTDGKDGQNGTDGENGADGKTPEFGPKKDVDELYYWAVDGEFVLDAEGKKIPLVTVGATPQLKIEDETWFVSYDDGNEWEELGAAVSVGIKEIEEVDGELVITMADGSQIAVPLGSPMKVVLGEFDAATLQYGNDLVIPYTIEGVEGEAVVFLLKEGEGFVVELVEETATSGKVTVSQQEAAETEKNLKVGIFAVGEDGTTVSQAVRLVSGVFYSVEGNKETYDVEAAGGKVEFTVATNAAFEVKTGAEWITYAQTKAVEEKVLSFDVAANEGEAREAAVEIVSGDITLGFTVAQAGGYVPAPEESLVGAYKITFLWVYGGTGPGDGGAGWVDMHNKTWWYDETTGHGIKAELDNYLEFTLTGFNADNTKSTGECTNWAGVDGKNWDTWFYNNLNPTTGQYRNPDAPKDGSAFYRQIPIGKSTWERDYTVTPNTVTFTDAEGNKTVLELLEPDYSFVPGYSDKNATNNTRVFPRNVNDVQCDLTFHKKITSGTSDNWNKIYTEIDKIFYRPRDFFIDVDKVGEIPAEAKTSESKWTPEFPDAEKPATLAGTYKYSADKIVSDTAVKGLIDQYGTWTEPLTDDGRKFCDIINTIKDDIYVFTPTGEDGNGNETGTVSFDGGDNGTWEYKVMDNQSARPYTVYDVTELYGFIAHDNTTTYLYDANAGTITFTTRGKEYVVDYLAPGTYKYSDKDVTVASSSTFAMHYDQGFTKSRIDGYSHYNGLRHVYTQARHWVLCLVKQ